MARDFFVADLQGRLGPHVLQGKIFFLNWLRLDHFIFCFVLVFFRGGGCVGAS